VTQDDARDHDLEALPSLHGWNSEIGGGFWVSVTAIRVAPDEGRPHGISYSLTLHSPGSGSSDTTTPIFHPSAAGQRKRSFRKRRAYDHRHRRNRITWYAFDSAPKLMEDFWNDVQSLLKEEGVPWME
jgi:hypothetical protein